MSLTNRDHFTSLFLICIPLISFSCLTALARTSRTVFCSSGARGYPWLDFHLKEKVFSLSPLSMKLAVDFYKCLLSC